MQEPTFSLTDLVFGTMPRCLDPVDRAILIDEQIGMLDTLTGEVADLRSELETAQEELEESQGDVKNLGVKVREISKERDRLKKEAEDLKKDAEAAQGGDAAKALLARLVAAIDGLGVARVTKGGKSVKLGALVIVTQEQSMAEALGEVLEEARGAIA